MSAKDDAIRHLTAADASRFLAKVQRGSADECWPWVACRLPRGYGMFAARRSLPVLAHRVAFFLANDRLPDNVVAHTCDNPSCCNPSHLFAATQGENMADRDAKGRLPKGEQHARARLNETQVREMRARHAAGEGSYRLAKAFGMSCGATRCVLQRRTWRHVS